MSNNEIRALNHAIAPLSSGGMVLLLNTGAIITAEDTAMLQALHSRDPRGVQSHLEKLADVGSGRFMETFYVGYGHKSIGDCGTVTLFIEGASMLAAKAIQDWQLYSGQECSTRYLDFGKQPFFDPVGTTQSGSILETLRSFYLESLPLVTEHLRLQFPRNESEDEKVYSKAINARAFDILRGYLPAGAMTNLTWHGNLRQTADKIAYLRHHPLKEVREIAQAIETVCIQANPHSFSTKRYKETEEFVENYMKNGYYFDESVSAFSLVHDGIDRKLLQEYQSILSSRPPKTELPKQLGETGVLRFEMLLDFGSYRDLQRQRSLIQRMPLLTVHHGFHPWYSEQLPDVVRKNAQSLLQQVEQVYVDMVASTGNKADVQCYVPMGYQVPLRFTGDLPALVYVAELRATPFVHPTLQERAIQLGAELDRIFSDVNLALYIDAGSQGRFDVRRGNQDIVQKN